MIHATSKFSFESSFSEAVDEGLLLLGESGKKAVFFYLEKNFHITKNEITIKLRAFSEAIESLFGAGAVYIKATILKCFYKKIGIPPPEKPESENFVESVTMFLVESRLTDGQ